MYFITVPEPITLINKVTGEPMRKDLGDSTPDDPWTMHRWLLTLILPDPALGKGYKAVRSASKIEAKFDGAKPGDVIAVEDEHRDLVCRVIDNPEAGGSAVVQMQLLPFAEAWKEAATEDAHKAKAA